MFSGAALSLGTVGILLALFLDEWGSVGFLIAGVRVSLINQLVFDDAAGYSCLPGSLRFESGPIRSIPTRLCGVVRSELFPEQ